MYVQTKSVGLSFEDLLKVAHRRNNEVGTFPYAVQTSRCSNCRYCQEGKCSLKECCCMADRVKAHSCTFSEMLTDCFSVLIVEPEKQQTVKHWNLWLYIRRFTVKVGYGFARLLCGTKPLSETGGSVNDFLLLGIVKRITTTADKTIMMHYFVEKSN